MKDAIIKQELAIKTEFDKLADMYAAKFPPGSSIEWTHGYRVIRGTVLYWHSSWWTGSIRVRVESGRGTKQWINRGRIILPLPRSTRKAVD